MNIVFWFIVFLAAALLWVLLSPLFGGVGQSIKDTANQVKDEINDDDEWEEEQ